MSHFPITYRVIGCYIYCSASLDCCTTSQNRICVAYKGETIQHMHRCSHDTLMEFCTTVLECTSGVLQLTTLHCTEYINLQILCLWLHARDLNLQVKELQDMHINQSLQPQCRWLFCFFAFCLITTSPIGLNFH